MTQDAKTETNVFTFPEGCIWKGPAFKIELDCPVSCSASPCRHAIYVADRRPKVLGWIIPRVVIAESEDYVDTGMCLDCILEAEKTLPRPPIATLIIGTNASDHSR